MAIDKRILWVKLRDLITNQYQQPDKYRILRLCHKILSNNPTKNCFIKGGRHNWRDLPPDKSLFHSAPGCGLPIGNLTSQIFANVYLKKHWWMGRPLRIRIHLGVYILQQMFNLTDRVSAQSLLMMLNTHEYLFGKGVLASVATDKGYYSLNNEQLLIEKGVLEIQLPRPNRALNAARETTLWTIRQLLHHRRVGIEPLIGHTKHGGQLGRSRMKSDETTKSAGYAAVFEFNLRQLARCLAGEVRPNVDVVNNIAVNNANIIEKMNMQFA